MHRALDEVTGGVDALYIGARGGMEEQLLAASGVPLLALPGFGLRGSGVGARLRAPFVFAAAVFRALGALRDFRPHVVVGTGGYASAAAVVAAVLLRIPRVLQEQNSVPGLVNRRLARVATLVLLSYETSRAWMGSAGRVAVVGNPLRAMSPRDRDEAARRFELDPRRTTLFVIGGSRGARSLNEAAVEAAPALLEDRDVQLLLSTGTRDYDDIHKRLPDEPGRVSVCAYIDDIEAAYSLADVAVARAGASSVFELAAFGVASIFVPYPHAADDHQRRNVEELSRRGAAVVVDDPDLSGERLAREATALLSDRGRREAMSRAMREWAPTDAARRAAKEILTVAKKKAHGATVEYAALRGTV
jgi:UDP-N-acetylglucosamine--N-acetylmuramyl-(pentapeptide) pyrophosphoryl-undecaprenol N-acetylglucosamine transferase